MNIVTNENVILVDVDDTLIQSYTPEKVFIEHTTVPKEYCFNYTEDPNILELDYYGTPVLRFPIQEHIDFVRSLKRRGYYIIVHSGNGYLWAKQVVTALKLQDCVDMIMTKACKHLDDDDNPTHVIGPRIFLKKEKT